VIFGSGHDPQGRETEPHVMLRSGHGACCCLNQSYIFLSLSLCSSPTHPLSLWVCVERKKERKKKKRKKESQVEVHREGDGS